MPIYAYKCASCGHQRDVLQKLSDPVLSQCPACGATAFAKQLTAAGFQLKGSGWYATDFKNGQPAAKPDDKKADDKKADDKTPAEKSADKPADTAAPAAAPAATPSPSAAGGDAAA